MVETTWSHFHHVADIGVRGVGPSPAAAFEQAALALTAVATDPAQVKANREVRIECEAPSLRLLLVDWLNSLIYRMAVDKVLFSRFAVTIEGSRLAASAWGEPIDRARHAPAVEPKGATFTELRVERRPDGVWLAQCVIDV